MIQNQKSVVFLCTSNAQAESQIKNAIPFTIATIHTHTHTHTHLGKHLIKELKECQKNCKTLLKEIIDRPGAVVHGSNPSTLGDQGWWMTWAQEFKTSLDNHDKIPYLQKITQIRWAWWCAPVVPATQEAEAGELPESRRQKLRWAEIMPLHSSLGNKSETPSHAHFSSTYTRIGTIQRRLTWPLRKDDTQIREAFHIKKKKKKILELIYPQDTHEMASGKG